MNLAFIRQKYNPFGGGERFLERITNVLVQTNINVHILSRGWENNNVTNKNSPSNINIHIINPFYIGRTWRDYSFAKAVREYINKSKFDVVQSNDRINGCQIYRAGDGLHCEWLLHKKQIDGAMSNINFAPYHYYQLAVEKNMLLNPNLETVICNSKMARDEVIKHFPNCKADLQIFYNGIDLKKFTLAINNSARNNLAKIIREQNINWSADKFTLIFVGSGFARKGLTQTLQALAQTINCQLIVVGSDKEINKYQQLTQKLQIVDKVYFAGGQRDVVPFYHSADVLCFPSVYDPLGGVVMEALACGLPTITSNKCGAQEFINEANGFVVDAWNIPQISDKINFLQNLWQTQTLTKMAQSATSIMQEYAMPKMAERLIEFYKSCRAR